VIRFCDIFHLGVSMDLEEACDMVLPLLQSTNGCANTNEDTRDLGLLCNFRYIKTVIHRPTTCFISD